VGAPPVIVKLPLEEPQVALVVTIVKLDGPGVIVKVGDSVKVQPRLLVTVIVGEPAPNPVIICPGITVPEVLVIEEIGTEFKTIIDTWPLLLPQDGCIIGFAIAAEGAGLTVISVVFVATQPAVDVPVTV
jgi:hypothetical protein